MAQSRRAFLGNGLGAVAMGLLGPSAFAGLDDRCRLAGAVPTSRSGPFHTLSGGDFKTNWVRGLPFHEKFTGDWPERQIHPPFPSFKTAPKPTESVDVVVVGGGISGLASAFLLKEHKPVVLEFDNRFGGSARGEVWDGTMYSLGSAYVITPDKGTFLDDFYRELKLDQVVRVNGGASQFEIELKARLPKGFWDGSLVPPDQQAAYQQYADVVAFYAENYPEIPLSGKPKYAAEVIDLDLRTLKTDIEANMKDPVPSLVQAALQAYCYSSFAAGWEEISAAGGWNFLAAEEFDRWVFPGGNTYLAHAMWERLRKVEEQKSTPYCMLRAGCRALDIQLNKGGALVVYQDSRQQIRSIQAKKVVVACPKFIAKNIIPDLDQMDQAKLNSMHHLQYRAYVVANVLLKAPIERDFYDIFLLGSGKFPKNDAEAQQSSRVVDVLSGHYARPPGHSRSVLTLYWPLPWGTGRFSLVPNDNPWALYATGIARRLVDMLDLLDVPKSAVQQVRMTRWGHPMPVSTPAFIADGHADNVRRPLDNTVYFVQQDNWALPAVENCLLDAATFTDQIKAGL